MEGIWYRFRLLTARAVAILLAGLLVTGCARTVSDPRPSVNYIPGQDYHLMMAELAIQRNQYAIAAQEYLTAAEQGHDSATARRATEFAFDYGFDRYALRSAMRWVELEPESTVAHEYIGRLQLRRYRLDAAVAAFARALGPGAQRSGDDYLALEADLAAEANAKGVMRVLQRLAVGEPRTQGWRLALARAAHRAGADELALSYALQVALATDDYEAQVLVSRILYSAGVVDAALNYLANLARAQPVAGLQLEYVRLLAASRREQAALQVLSQLFERYGRTPELLNMRALIGMSSGDFDQAEQDFNEVTATGRNVQESFYRLGEIELQRGNFHKAIGHFERVATGEFLIPAQSQIARAWMDLGEPERGLEHLQQFQERHPRYRTQLLELRASMFQGLDRDAEALAVYDELLATKLPTPGQLVSRGILLEKLGRRDDAIADMRKAVELAPDDAEALNSLGYTLLLTGRRNDEAYRLIRLAVELAPYNPAILDSMGWAVFRRGQPELAVSWLDQAWKRLKDPEIAAHLGEVLWVTGERDSAARIWQEAQIRFPDSEPLRETIGRLRP